MNRGMLLAAGLCALATAATGQPATRAQAQAPQASAPASGVRHPTAQQWREDLRFMAAEMERRHANLYHTVSRERFARAVADLDARIPSLQRNEIIVELMRIAALVGDGHTRIDHREDQAFGFPSLPLRLYLFEDGVFVRAAAPQHAALVGARIEAVGGVPIEEAIRRVSEISARDNEMGPKLFVPLYLNMPDVLHALKLSARRDAAVFRVAKGGRSWTVTVPAGAVEPEWPDDTDISLTALPEGWVDARATPRPPLWLQAPLDFHRMVELPQEKALYVQLNMVTNVKGQSLTQFGRKIRERAETTNPRALILDLRLNQGGAGNLRNGFVRELIKAEDADTRLLVLTWRGTFSASQFILDDLDRLTDAVFLGEPASSKPSSYGDAYATALPNSGIEVRSSIVWWQAGQNREPWTWVDVATPLTFAAYAAGRDPALEAALAYAPGPALAEQLRAAVEAGGIEAARRTLAAYRTTPANRYTDIEQQLAAGAERLYNGGHRDAGLIVAELGAETFPDSVDANNVFAHIAEAMKKPDVARRAAKRVLQLDPNSRTARALLRRLGG